MSNGSAATGASAFFCSHGGVFGPSSSAFPKVPALIFVDPPSAFSPKNEDICTWLASMSSRSCTFPKSPRFASKAPEKRLDPTALPICLDLTCWNSKSASYGPSESDCPWPEREKVQSPSLSLKAKENDRVSPGPMDDTPSLGSTVAPRLVLMLAEIPPIGIADSLVRLSVTSTMSSSSSSISIRTVCRTTESEPAVAECS